MAPWHSGRQSRPGALQHHHGWGDGRQGLRKGGEKGSDRGIEYLVGAPQEGPARKNEARVTACEFVEDDCATLGELVP